MRGLIEIVLLQVENQSRIMHARGSSYSLIGTVESVELTSVRLDICTLRSKMNLLKPPRNERVCRRRTPSSVVSESLDQPVVCVEEALVPRKNAPQPDDA